MTASRTLAASAALSLATLTAGAIVMPATTAQAATATVSSPAAANQLVRGYKAPSKATAIAQARHLRVAKPASMAGYSRAQFPHWLDASAHGWPVAPSNACNARNAALYRDGNRVKVNARTCAIVSGSWLDPYTAKTSASNRSQDVDHLVPLAAAWRSGANRWSRAQRIRYANDPLVLVTVGSSINRAKGDKTVDLWKPPNKAAWCLYAKRTVTIKTTYRLTTTASEQKTLLSMLGTCNR